MTRSGQPPAILLDRPANLQEPPQLSDENDMMYFLIVLFINHLGNKAYNIDQLWTGRSRTPTLS